MSPTTQIWEGVAIGVGAVILATASGYAGYRLRRWIVGFYNLLLRGVRAAEAIQAELAYMRSLTGGTIGEQQVGGDPEEQQAKPTPINSVWRAPQNVPFPPAILDRFPIEEPPPDATMADTDVDLLHQTDRDLAAMEVLENMRQRGIPVEDSDVEHPGVVADAK